MIFSLLFDYKANAQLNKNCFFLLSKKIWFIILDRVEIKIVKYEWQLFQAFLQLFKVNNFEVGI